MFDRLQSDLPWPSIGPTDNAPRQHRLTRQRRWPSHSACDNVIVWLLALGLMLAANPIQADDRGALQDPTRPAARAQATDNDAAEPEPLSQARSWRLQAVFIRDDSRHAIIGGHMAGIGERFEGVRVLEIEPSYVTLSDSDGTFRLHWSNNQGIEPSEESPNS